MTSNDDFEQRFEQRLRGFAATASARPDPEVVSRAVATRPTRVRPGSTFRPRIGGTNVRTRTLLLVAALVVGSIGTALVAGGLPHPPLLAATSAPSQGLRPSIVPIGTASASFGLPVQFGQDQCPGGTRLADIRDVSTPGADGTRWVAAPRPTNVPAGPSAGKIAVTTALPGGNVLVYLVDPSTDTACVLAELPYGFDVADVMWAPAGDALAISGSGGGVYVWSQAGITKAFSSPMYTRLAWSPDGAWLGIAEAALWALPASGAPVRFRCEPQPGQPTAGSGYEPMCPFFPHMVWSLDSKEVAVGGGDRAGMFGTASLADPTFRHFGIPGIVEADTVPVEWLDAQELLAFDQNDELILVPLNDPWSYRVLTRIPSGGLQPGLHYDESVSADGSMLKVTELASGRETTLFTAPPGSGDGIGNVTWSPDGWRLAFTIPDSAGRPTLKLVNAVGGGLKELLVGQFNLAGGGSLTTDTPWQSIWP